MAQPLQLQAPVVAARRISPGVTLLRLSAPTLAQRATPGQFVLVRCGESSDPLLRRALPLLHIDPPEVSLLVRADEPGRRLLGRLSAGQTADIVGPLGKGFTIGRMSRRLLLVGEGMGVAALAALAAQAVRSSLEVTLAAGAPTAGTAFPADLLPAEVEYRLATADGSLGERGSAATLTPPLVLWADQVFAAGSPALYRELAGIVTRGRLHVEQDFAQVWLLGPVACGLGACQSCALETRRGAVLTCHEGPVFPLSEVAAP